MMQWYGISGRLACASPRATHLVVTAHLVEGNVYSECGGVVVRPERGLLVGLIPNYKCQIKLSLQRHTSRDKREREKPTGHAAL